MLKTDLPLQTIAFIVTPVSARKRSSKTKKFSASVLHGLLSLARRSGVISRSLVANDRLVSLTRPVVRHAHPANEALLSGQRHIRLAAHWSDGAESFQDHSSQTTGRFR
ncbi:hypothetical protein L596_019963 [Steinernema carpocapsae]|uniref:Uncharacterized protein n=1 Tax=Steinernema carpocapsae TaxID=34508 RepID=A0A4U5MS72_STECR|nr:hypothetical protein L596_019963 [Steinernema carpocapsae]